VGYRFEGRDLLLLEVISDQVELGVVDGQATLSALGATQQGLNRKNRHAVIGAVGVLEVQMGGPVVREVLRHLTGCAGGSLTDIPFHGSVEGVAADDVVDMGRRDGAWLDDGVEALDSQGRAGEAEAGLNRRDQRECCRERLHVHGVPLYLVLGSVVLGGTWQEEDEDQNSAAPFLFQLIYSFCSLPNSLFLGI
jgi:hypothetical protein